MSVQVSAAGGLRERWGLLGGFVPYQRTWLVADLLAGATLAAVAIPEGLGYAKIAGMPPQTGLYTCLLPVILFALLASSRRLVVGADSATAAISAAAVGALAAGNPGLYVSLSGILAIMSGLLLLVAGMLHLGFLSDFMSRSVLAGFLTGVGIQIAIGQLPSMLGVSATGSSTAEKLWDTLRQLGNTNPADLTVAALVIATILTLGRVAPRVPGPLVAVAAAITAAAVLGLEAKYGVVMVGALPKGLPTITVPTAPWAAIAALAPTAGTLLLVQVAQSVSTASAFAIAHGDQHNPNRDLTGLGAANIASGFGSSFVVNGSPTKTAISDKAGARSQLAMLTLAGLTVVVLLFLTGVFDYLPEAALAAVVFVIAIHLMKIGTLRMLYGLPERADFWVALSTVAVVALVGVGGGILWAIVASILVHLANTTHPHNTVLTLDQLGERLERPAAPGLETLPGMIVYRFAANLYFANAPRLVEQVQELLANAPNPVKVFVLDGSEIQDIDWTSEESLRAAIQMCRSNGTQFVIARLPEQARVLLDFYGISELMGPDGYVDTVRHALHRYGGPAGAK